MRVKITIHEIFRFLNSFNIESEYRPLNQKYFVRNYTNVGYQVRNAVRTDVLLFSVKR